MHWDLSLIENGSHRQQPNSRVSYFPANDIVLYHSPLIRTLDNLPIELKSSALASESRALSCLVDTDGVTCGSERRRTDSERPRSLRKQNEFARGLALLEQSMDDACVGQWVLLDFNFDAPVDHEFEEFSKCARRMLHARPQVEAP